MDTTAHITTTKKIGLGSLAAALLVGGAIAGSAIFASSDEQQSGASHAATTGSIDATISPEEETAAAVEGPGQPREAAASDPGEPARPNESVDRSDGADSAPSEDATVPTPERSGDSTESGAEDEIVDPAEDSDGPVTLLDPLSPPLIDRDAIDTPDGDPDDSDLMEAPPLGVEPDALELDGDDGTDSLIPLPDLGGSDDLLGLSAAQEEAQWTDCSLRSSNLLNYATGQDVNPLQELAWNVIYNENFAARMAADEAGDLWIEICDLRDLMEHTMGITPGASLPF